MGHDSEGQAARFLGGAMSVQDQAEFSRHLLRCADCWSEVGQARRGRSLAESMRTAASAFLRDRIRGLAEAESLGGGSGKARPRDAVSRRLRDL